MERSLDDAELWLPSEEDLLLDRENLKELCFPTEFPFEVESLGFNSALSSPVGSSSTETESSDEEDFLAGLTHRLAQSSLHETRKLSVPSFAQKSWGVVGSPESTLSGVGSWSASSNESPNGPSQATSPTTPFGAGNDTWDLIYAVAGEVARLKMTEQGRNFQSPARSSQPHPAILARNQKAAFYSNNCLSNANQFRQARHEQMMNQEDFLPWEKQVKMGWSQNTGRSVGYDGSGRCGHQPPGLPQSSWPSLQMHNRYPQSQKHACPGMRPVFLGESDGKKKKCAGTGVFLPRRYGDQPDSRRKSASPVLLPPKVVQALNLSFSDMNGEMAHLRFSDPDGIMGNKNSILKQQRRNLWAEGPLNHELRLPQEWTY